MNPEHQAIRDAMRLEKKQQHAGGAADEPFIPCDECGTLGTTVVLGLNRCFTCRQKVTRDTSSHRDIGDKREHRWPSFGGGLRTT